MATARMKPLKLRSSGDDVKRVQAFLKKKLKANIKVDGKFTPETEEAVRAFQERNKLKVDGIIGPKTFAMIGKQGGEAPGDESGDGKRSKPGGRGGDGGSAASGKGETRMLKELKARLDHTRRSAESILKVMDQADKEVASARDDSQLVTVDLHRMNKDVARYCKMLATSTKALDSVAGKIASSVLE